MLSDEDIDELYLYAQCISDETSDLVPAMLELYKFRSNLSGDFSRELECELEALLDVYRDDYKIVEKEVSIHLRDVEVRTE